MYLETVPKENWEFFCLLVMILFSLMSSNIFLMLPQARFGSMELEGELSGSVG